METVKFNINGHVRVKLTPHGKQCIRANWDKLNEYSKGNLEKLVPYREPEEDKDGWSEWQLWELMQECGPHISQCSEICFETEIEIELGTL